MGDLWFKIKTWTKIGFFALLTILVLVFVVKNLNRTVKVWVWNELETSVLSLLLMTFLTGVIGTLLARAVFKTIHQIRDMRAKSRVEKMERDAADQRAKAAMLKTRPPADNA